MKKEPLYQQIQNIIKEQIQSGKLRLGDRVPSEKELMEEFHVSQITTKNALTGLAEEGIVVRIKGKGTFVAESDLLKSQQHYRQESNGLIGLILPTMKTKVEQELVNYIEKYTSQKGYQLLIKITRESQFEEADAIEMFQGIGVKGMIIFPTEKEIYNEAILRLTLDKFPLVLVDRYLENIRTYSVSSDNRKGTFTAISHLLDKGHTHIGLISPIITNTVTEERTKGFEDAFIKNDIMVNKKLWLFLNFNNICFDKTPDIIKEFLMENPNITSLFVMNAELAIYTYEAIQAINKESNRHIELISFDSPGIIGSSYIEQDIDECSKQTINLLVEQIDGGYNPKRIFVPVRLKVENK